MGKEKEWGWYLTMPKRWAGGVLVPSQWPQHPWFEPTWSHIGLPCTDCEVQVGELIEVPLWHSPRTIGTPLLETILRDEVEQGGTGSSPKASALLAQTNTVSVDHAWVGELIETPLWYSPRLKLDSSSRIQLYDRG